MMLTHQVEGAPHISVTSPAPGISIFNMTPAIALQYSSDDAQKPLDLATVTVSVTIAGHPRNTTITAGAASATVALSSPLVAGTLVIDASVADSAGTIATDHRTYSVVPTFSAVVPDSGHIGDTITLTIIGLDPQGSNVARFSWQYDSSTSPTGLASPVIVGSTVTTVVPPEAITGDVYVVVNGQKSGTSWFTVRTGYVDCGLADKMLSLPDGSLLLKHDYYLGVSISRNTPPAGCPTVPVTTGQASAFDQRPVVTLAYPDHQLLVQDSALDSNSAAVLDIAIDKTAGKVAVLNYSGGLQVSLYDLNDLRNGIRNPIVTTFSPWNTFGVNADFDSEGNLYVLTADNGLPLLAGLKLVLLPAAAIQTGGSQAYSIAKQFPLDYGDDLRISCDKHAYIAAIGQTALNGYPETLLALDLQTMTVTGQTTLPRNVFDTFTLALTCHSGEVWGTGPAYLPDDDFAVRIWRWTVGGSVDTMDVLPGTAYAGMSVTVSTTGTMLAYLDETGVVGTRAIVDPCTSSCGLAPARLSGPSTASTCSLASLAPATVSMLPFCALQTSSDSIVIDRSTTRWLAAKDTTTDAKISFTASSLDAGDFVQKATVTLIGSSTVAPIIATFTGAQNPYTALWKAPTRCTNPQDVSTCPLSGDYTIAITATSKNGKTLSSSSKDPNATLSLVEVSGVTLSGNIDDDPTLPAIAEQYPPQGRVGGGKRIFAEAPSAGAAVNDSVTVTATISAKLPGVMVYFQSYDVDDPANNPTEQDPNNPGPPAPNQADLDQDRDPLNVKDNRGAVPRADDGGQQGHLEGLLSSTQAVTDANGTVTVTLQVSSNPGDNYRVAASTIQTGFSDFKAYQPSDTGELRHGSKTGGDGQPLPLAADEQKMVSPVVTVWRTLHILTNAMSKPLLDASADANNPERNFIKGTATAIQAASTSGSFPLDITLAPEPGVALTDESPDLDNSNGNGTDNGRFEHGTLCLGTAPSLQSSGTCTSTTVNLLLLGNGTHYVRTNDIIKGKLAPGSKGQAPILTAFVNAWDSQAGEFTISADVTARNAHLYRGGTLTIGDVVLSVIRVEVRAAGNNAKVVVVTQTGGTAPKLRFYLIDDDMIRAPAAFMMTSTLLQAGQDRDASANILAQAYIVPVYVASARTPSFQRNIHVPKGTSSADAVAKYLQPNLDPWRDINGTPEYWVAYAQGAFQGDRWEDGDPDHENRDPNDPLSPGFVEGGVTVTPRAGSTTPSAGSFIFVESIRDAANPTIFDQCLNETIAHELGHQFGLPDKESAGGIMHQGCPVSGYFDDASLGVIRIAVNP